MKKVLIFLFTISLFFGVVSFAGATLITYTDKMSWGDNNKISHGELFSWEHTFDKPSDEILSGSLTVWLRDDDDRACEFALGWADGGNWAFGEVDTDSYSYAINAWFLTDGKFTVSILALFGDFFIDKSLLEFTCENSNPSPVPEPATMLLFGCGLIGLAVVGRKKFQ